MQIDIHIAQLLQDYDCVIVPQLGGFVTNHRPARLDERSGIAHPAQKDLGFNRNLTRSDGLLEQALQKAHGYSFEEATVELRAEVQAYWAKLRKGETVKWQKIGVLFLDTERNLRFEPSQEINFLKDSFGFEAFQMPTRISLSSFEKEASAKEIPSANPTKTEGIVLPEIYRKNKSIYWVAAATMLPFLGMSLYMGLTTDFKSPTDLSLAEFFPLGTKKKQVEAAFTPRDKAFEKDLEGENGNAWPEQTTVFPYSFETERVDSTGVWINLEKVEMAMKLPLPKETASGKYHLIAGCFAEEKNAEKFVNQLTAAGHGAAILDFHKGLYRVSVSNFNDYERALEGLAQLRSSPKFAQSWMLKKEI